MDNSEQSKDSTQHWRSEGIVAEAILDPSLLRSSTNLSRAIAGLLVFLEIRRARPIRFPSLPVASRVSIGVRMRKSGKH